MGQCIEQFKTYNTKYLPAGTHDNVPRMAPMFVHLQRNFGLNQNYQCGSGDCGRDRDHWQLRLPTGSRSIFSSSGCGTAMPRYCLGSLALLSHCWHRLSPMADLGTSTPNRNPGGNKGPISSFRMLLNYVCWIQLQFTDVPLQLVSVIRHYFRGIIEKSWIIMKLYHNGWKRTLVWAAETNWFASSNAKALASSNCR